MGNPFKKPKIPAPPPIKPPAEMPSEDQLRKARMQEQERLQGRSGRQSTILSGGDKPVGL